MEERRKEKAMSVQESARQERSAEEGNNVQLFSSGLEHEIKPVCDPRFAVICWFRT